MNKDFCYSNFKIATILLFVMALSILQFSCRKLVEVNPPTTSLTSENAFSTDATAAAVLTGIYTNMSSNAYRFVTGSQSISVRSGLSADELTLFGGGVSLSNQDFTRYFQNRLIITDDGSSPWTGLYGCLLPVNTALDRLNESKSLNPSVKQQLIGEAKFLRAFCHFYLVNLYGDVPLVVSSDYRVNSIISRTPKDLVYQQIIADLKDAQSLLSDGYVGSDAKTSTLERIRPNKWAATALLSRAYLYIGDWANAETQATSIINQSAKYSLSTLNNAFLKNSNEAIWQLQPVNSDRITEDARSLTLNAPPDNSNRPIFLSSYILNAFEPGDARRTSWVKDVTFNGIDYSYAFKYKASTTQGSFTEYLMILRLSEQYLIRAEARTRLNKISEAKADLNTIRTRAGLANTTANDENSLLTSILNERQVELFTEWGHRWLDLKRTNKVDVVMSVITPQKGGTWSSNWAWYPLPLYDIQQNSKLVQNSGY